MILRGFGLIAKNQRGFTLIELLVAIAVGSLIAGGITMSIFHVLVNSTQSMDHMTAVKQVENAIHWMRRDALMAQIVEPTNGSGFPLKLTWVEWDNTSNEVTYSVQNGNLQRERVTYDANDVIIDNQTGVVAEHIDTSPEMTNCQRVDSTLTIKITATIAGVRTSSETRVVEIIPRHSM